MLENISLRNEIPNTILAKEVTSLNQLNLEEELLLQYTRVKNFLEQIEGDESIPPNQVAQVMNTCTAILKEIVKTQETLYNSERAKKLEIEVVNAMRAAPQQAQEAFFKRYLEMTT